MHIFIICNKSPYPPREGGPIAMYAIIRGLIDQGHQVKVLALNTNKYFVDSAEIPPDFRKATNLEMVTVNLSINPFKAFINLFTTESYHVERFISHDIESKISEILQNNRFDVIQLETLYMTSYIDLIRKYSNGKIILRAHNIEHLIWERMAMNCTNPVKRFYLNHLFRTLKRFELMAFNQVDGIAAITKKDADTFIQLGCRVPVTPVPFGIDPDDYAKYTDIKPEIPSLFHIGSMNWLPNVEGIKWFLEKVWNRIHREFPELKLYLAGRMMPPWLLNARYPNVIVVGEVENALKFIRSKWIMIAPLFSGSGIRIKIIEAMAAGKPVVTTTIGAEGINYTNDKDILIADTADEFVDALKQCLQDPNLCTAIGKNAKTLILSEYDNHLIISNLVGFYDQILAS
jgi:glycosyltransferase involved in cell wall biosynthesis